MTFLNPSVPSKHSEDFRARLHDGKKIEASVVIRASPEDVFRVWQDFENLPQLFPYLKKVEVLSETRSHWVLQPPQGPRFLEWDAEIIEKIPGEVISWKTLGESGIQHSGSVWFQELPFDQGCAVRLHVIYTVGDDSLLPNFLGPSFIEDFLHRGLDHLRDFFEAPEV